MAAAYVEIDIGSEDAQLFCPGCGAKLISEDGAFGSRRCSHFLFGFVDQGGEWESVPDAFAPILQEILSESDEGDMTVPWDEDFLARCPDGTIVFALSASGIACGPVSLTVCVGVILPGLEDAGRTAVRRPDA